MGMVRAVYAPLDIASAARQGGDQEVGLEAAAGAAVAPAQEAVQAVDASGRVHAGRFGTSAAALGLALPALACICWLLLLSHRQQRAYGNPTHFLQLQEEAVQRFVPLGSGLCRNLDAELPTMLWFNAEVGPQGSPECEMRCLQNPNCTGFSTLKEGRCGLITNSSFYPSFGNATQEPNAACWWRHTYLRDSSDLLSEEARPIPKIVWSYWHQSHPRTSGSVPAFLSLCHATWRQLNPDYEVHILDRHSVWKWLSAEDLPKQFGSLSVQHRSDAIRLALLVKYGGVWVDASTMMTKPLSHLLGDDPRIRTFLAFRQYGITEEMAAREHRLNFTYRVENWFIAAPPKDPFIQQTKECVSLIYESGANKHLAETGLFNQRQLEQIHRTLDLWNYLTTHACFFKVLDEDAGLARWWNSPRVRVIDPLAGLESIVSAGMPALRHLFFYEHDKNKATLFFGAKTGLLKWTGSMRKEMIEGVPVQNVLCFDNTTFADICRGTGIARHCPFKQDIVSNSSSGLLVA